MPSVARSRSVHWHSAPPQGSRTGADQEPLILLMIDGALEAIAQARASMLDEAAGQGRPLHSAVLIIRELRSSLDLRAGGPIAANLDDLYDYMGRQLVVAGLQREVAALDEVSHLLREVRCAGMSLPPEVHLIPVALAPAA
ncbi:MAG TPA: flagellar export chaperone FliS [Steroidobacteraceae bacterium]|nr:flagellar export chaperone FliS [Steroidobacteraceae bacterium]